jgi:hypothetical protein
MWTVYVESFGRHWGVCSQEKQGSSLTVDVNTMVFRTDSSIAEAEGKGCDRDVRACVPVGSNCYKGHALRTSWYFPTFFS